ncbi:hypothetical protein P7228_05835 [Altererythrobacter arenosus]|uniref:Peptidase M48 domain-containing protein n=1 Tax=Altererythrobacter arenosus TaxID=3032592 RepID=A0ABY8FU96_9SPHN|nr:hypothetical protein [Altererythrobacter sp. CAU 1644]WFL78584.1 hypothetical protein P7228_05835 [Altererythrobacter sp. CAU 1644]
MRYPAGLAALLLLVGWWPIHAAEAHEPLDPVAVEHELYLTQNQLLQDVGWKLVAGNAPFCADTRLAAGLQLQDMRSYGAPEQMRSLLGLDGDFAVLAIAADSPAADTQLVPGTEIRTIDGDKLSVWPAEARLDWRRDKRLHDAIDSAMAREGSVAIGLANGGEIAISGREACTSRFELAGGGARAVADGERVQIGTKFVGLAYPEEEFAAAIAHELAHNILGHRQWLDANGRKQHNVRRTEREADRLMPWLLANAGYEPAAAARFMERWGPANDGGIFRRRSHDGWDERLQVIRAEIDSISAVQGTGGVADWSTHFSRDILPEAAN